MQGRRPILPFFSESCLDVHGYSLSVDGHVEAGASPTGGSCERGVGCACGIEFHLSVLCQVQTIDDCAAGTAFSDSEYSLWPPSKVDVDGSSGCLGMVGLGRIGGLHITDVRV